MKDGVSMAHFSVFKSIFNQRGSSLIPAIFTMVVLGLGTASVLNIRSNGLSETGNVIDKTAAEHLAIAGLELAKHRLNNGIDPDIVSINNYGGGEIRITDDPATRTISAEGIKGIAKSKYQMTTQYAADCMFFPNPYDINFGPTSGGLYAIKMQKKCLDKVILSRLRISWAGFTPSQKFVKIIFDGNIVYDDSVSPTVGGPTGGASSGVDIDIKNITITDGVQRQFDIMEMIYPAPGMEPTPPTTFTVEFCFTDGSCKSRDYAY